MARVRKSLATDEAANALSSAIVGWLEKTNPADIWKTCVTCNHLDKKDGRMCGKYRMIPPATVVVGIVECSGYRDDEEIPF